MEENAETTVKKVYGVPFQKGNDPRRNLAGRPEGSVGYKKMMDEAIREYAKLNKLDEDEIRKRIYMVGIAGALNKDYNYYKDFLDRHHGKAKEDIDLTVDAYSHQDLDEETEKQVKEFIQWKKDKLLNKYD